MVYLSDEERPGKNFGRSTGTGGACGDPIAVSEKNIWKVDYWNSDFDFFIDRLF